MEQSVQNGSNGYQAEKMWVFNDTQPRNRSIIAEVVNILSKIPASSNQMKKSRSLPAEIRKKMDHNNLIKCRCIIESYKNNIIDLNKVYNTLEEERTGQTDKLLQVINDIYEEEIVDFIEDDSINIDLLREKSDEVFENILNKLKKEVLESANLDAYNEDVHIAVRLIVADAFIRCIVLENPEDLE